MVIAFLRDSVIGITSIIWVLLIFQPGLFRGQCDNKFGPLAGRALGRNHTVMSLHNFATDGQANPRPVILTSAMQPLKDLKNAIQIFFIKANAIIFHRQLAEGIIY
jgi:hypothetical protein